ncbi:MAG: protein kinase [Myxococcales bacterium]|nr:protein kinase [Myxococcales bacterium]
MVKGWQLPLRSNGICPVCGTEAEVGTPCPRDRCRRRGYHAIPAEYAAEGEEALDGLIGQCWNGYLLVRHLGEGGVGAIYLALHVPELWRAALKVLKAGAAPMLVERFHQEAAALARLAHPNIVRLLDFGEFGDRPYLVMEYVEGAWTLQDALAAKPLPRPQALLLLRQLIGALDEAHRWGVIHRDVSPNNIMLQPVQGAPFSVRLVDFGLVKFADDGRQSTTLLAGTPAYMAPEQLHRRQIGPWTDWFAVGAIACEVLLQRHPYGLLEADDILRLKLRDDYDPTESIAGEGWPEPVMAFFRQALAHDPIRRFHDAHAFNAAFEQMVAALPSPAAVRGVVEPTVKLDALSDEAIAAHLGTDVASLRAAEKPMPAQLASRSSLRIDASTPVSELRVTRHIESEASGGNRNTAPLPNTPATPATPVAPVAPAYLTPEGAPATAPPRGPAATHTILVGYGKVGGPPAKPPPSRRGVLIGLGVAGLLTFGAAVWFLRAPGHDAEAEYALALRHAHAGKVEDAHAALARALEATSDPEAMKARARDEAAFKALKSPSINELIDRVVFNVR